MRPPRFMLLTLASLLLTVATAQAQSQFVEFRVYIVYQDGSRIGEVQGSGQAGVDSANRSATPGANRATGGLGNMQIRVQILDPEGGGVAAEGYPNNEGTAQFRIVGSVIKSDGSRLFPAYRIRVFGSEIEEAWLENVEPGRADRMVTVAIRRKGEKPIAKSDESTVSASGLMVPKKAQKELDKGNEALAEKKFAEAKTRFSKAIEIYPPFDQAHNNLGVVLLELGDADAGKKAFQKALEINDKFATAYVNLARIAMRTSDYSGASELLTKSLSIEPLNPEALSMLCQSDVIAQNYKQVVAISKRLHGVPHLGMPLCHFGAGLAYQNLQRPADAIAEYNLYLQEAGPGDALVVKAREAIEELSRQTAVQK